MAAAGDTLFRDPSCPDLHDSTVGVSGCVELPWTRVRGTPLVTHGDEGAAAAAGDTLLRSMLPRPYGM